jgi:hypothetical protein
MALRSAKFQEVVAQVATELADRGISIPAPGVAEIVEGSARQAAEQLGMGVTQALEHADPRHIADSIAAIIDQEELAARPPQDGVLVEMAVARIPMLITSLSETGNVAASNDDLDSVHVALDPISRLAAILQLTITNGAPQAVAEIDRGMLIEAAAVMMTASERLSAGEWSTCRCGKQHGQGRVDTLLANVLRDQAREIDQLLTSPLRAATRATAPR